MKSRSGLLGAVAILMLLLPGTVAAATTYTYIQTDCTPKDASGLCSTPVNGGLTFIFSSISSSKVPSGINHWACVNGIWNSKPDGTGVSDGPCAAAPYVAPGPACSSQIGFVNYQITQLKVYTPADPTNPDVYMLGSATAPGIASTPIILTSSTTLNLNFGPGASPQVIGGHTYYWWRISLNGHPVYPNQNIIKYPNPSPTGMSGQYQIDYEGIMHCGRASTGYNQQLYFDIQIPFTTPEFGSMFVATAFGAAALLLVRRRMVGRLL